MTTQRRRTLIAVTAGYAALTFLALLGLATFCILHHGLIDSQPVEQQAALLWFWWGPVPTGALALLVTFPGSRS